jgi:hypothetical protein
MPRNPNAGGKGPKVTRQSGNKGPIFGKPSSLAGTTKPWSLNKGSNRNLNTGKGVKKS